MHTDSNTALFKKQLLIWIFEFNANNTSVLSYTLSFILISAGGVTSIHSTGNDAILLSNNVANS